MRTNTHAGVGALQTHIKKMCIRIPRTCTSIQTHMQCMGKAGSSRLCIAARLLVPMLQSPGKGYCSLQQGGAGTSKERCRALIPLFSLSALAPPGIHRRVNMCVCITRAARVRVRAFSSHQCTGPVQGIRASELQTLRCVIWISEVHLCSNTYASHGRILTSAFHPWGVASRLQTSSICWDHSAKLGSC